MRITRTRVSGLLFAVAMAVVAGCQNAPHTRPAPSLDFTPRGQFTLDAAGIEVVSLYKPPLRAPNVEHEFPMSPEAAARRWAQDRLRATGTSRNRAVFTIEDAKVIETQLPRQQGLPGVLRDDQSERYDAALKVELAILNGEVKIARVFAEATASRSVPESITIEGRRLAWAELTAALMEQIDQTLEAEIRRSMPPHLR
ncbi:MAG: hypothetical protein EXQ88_03425 [Alphaproteobacteria bacterium]|nr:hypothetical protein [Alphaproteobacteria bacterium]